MHQTHREDCLARCTQADSLCSAPVCTPCKTSLFYASSCDILQCSAELHHKRTPRCCLAVVCCFITDNESSSYCRACWGPTPFNVTPSGLGYPLLSQHCSAGVSPWWSCSSSSVSALPGSDCMRVNGWSCTSVSDVRLGLLAWLMGCVAAGENLQTCNTSAPCQCISY